MVPPENDLNLGDDPLSALYDRVEPKQDQNSQKMENIAFDAAEDEALALALYLSQMESSI